MKLFVLIANETYGSGSYPELFNVRKDVTIETFREAARDFLTTEEGQTALELTGGCFDWGDFIAHVPMSFLNQYGIFSPDQTDLTFAAVEYEESLVD